MSAAFDSTPRLEKYDLLEELGHGGMATVYRALDRRLGREVAVKIIHRHLRDEREVKERFAREAKAVAKLRHPGIVEVYDVSEPDEIERYLVVELVKGITLRKLLKEHAPLPPELVLGIGVCIADALHHAHEQGVVHRDVKPENVLLALPARLRTDKHSDGPSQPSHSSASFAPGSGVQAGSQTTSPIGLKLTDFGIAKVLDVQGVTSTGEVLGSPAHMAPEQIEGQSVGAKADIFSLGVLLYEALTGSLPFQGSNPAQVLRRVLEGKFVPTERARPEVGSLIGRLVDKALSHDQALRFEDAEAFANAMRKELSRCGFEAPMVELSKYLEEPRAYEEHHVVQIVPALLAAARAARQKGEVALAASLYNRALSLRPSDPAIVAEVARLTRLQRIRSKIVPLLAGAMLVALAFAALYVISRKFRRDAWQIAENRRAANAASLEIKRGRAADVAAAAGVGRNTASPETTGGLVAALPVGTVDSRLSPAGLRNGARVAQSTRQTVPVGTRTVQVELRGAKGSRLLIDGVERPWFGVKHELDYGVHRFHVVAPNDNCCVVPEPRVVKVGPGEGEIRIAMAVEFRDAVLQFAATDGSTLTCGELFPGILEAPGRRSVRLTQAETRASCTLIPPTDSGKRPRTIDVVLRPGGTFTVTGT